MMGKANFTEESKLVAITQITGRGNSVADVSEHLSVWASARIRFTGG